MNETSISVEFTDDVIADTLLNAIAKINDLTASKSLCFSKKVKASVLVVFSSSVAINMFSSALYDVIKNFASHETTINGKQIPADKSEINIFINSNVQIYQSAPKTDCDNK